MANNRMFLLHRPTGKSVLLGKRMGWGWYAVPENVKERIEALFAIVDGSEYEGSQDDFCVALEDAGEAPMAHGDWTYGGIPPEDGIHTLYPLEEKPPQ